MKPGRRKDAASRARARAHKASRKRGGKVTGKQAALDYENRSDHPNAAPLYRTLEQSGTQSPYGTHYNEFSDSTKGMGPGSARACGIDPKAWYAYARRTAYGWQSGRAVFNHVGHASGKPFPDGPMKFGAPRQARKCGKMKAPNPEAEAFAAGENPLVQWSRLAGDVGWTPAQRTGCTAVLWGGPSGGAKHGGSVVGGRDGEGEQSIIVFGGMNGCGTGVNGKVGGKLAVDGARPHEIQEQADEFDLVLGGSMPSSAVNKGTAVDVGACQEAIESASARPGASAGDNRTNSVSVFTVAYDKPPPKVETDAERRHRLRREKKERARARLQNRNSSQSMEELAAAEAQKKEEEAAAKKKAEAEADARSRARVGRWRAISLEASPEVGGAVPSPRSGHSATIVGNEMWVFGGEGDYAKLNDRNVFCDLYALNLLTWRWRSVPMQGATPRARRRHTATLLRTPIEFHHALCRQKQHRSDKWRELRPHGGEPASLLLLGGQGPDRVFGVDTFIDDVSAYDIAEEKWHQVLCDGPAPSPRSMHTATLVDETGLVFVFGGVSLPLFSTMAAPRLSKAGDKLTRDDLIKASKNVKISKRGTTRTVNHRAGGHFAKPDVMATNDLFVLDTRATPMFWRNAGDDCIGEAPTPRAGHSAVRFANRAPSCVFFFGGRLGQAAAARTTVSRPEQSTSNASAAANATTSTAVLSENLDSQVESALSQSQDFSIWVLETVELRWSRVQACSVPRQCEPSWRYDHVAVAMDFATPRQGQEEEKVAAATQNEARRYDGSMFVFGGSTGSTLCNADVLRMQLPPLPPLAVRENGVNAAFDPPPKSWPRGKIDSDEDSEDGLEPQARTRVGAGPPEWRSREYFAEPWRHDKAMARAAQRRHERNIMASTARGRAMLVHGPGSTQMRMQHSSAGSGTTRPKSAPSSRWQSQEASGVQRHSLVAANTSVRGESHTRSRPQTARPAPSSPAASALVARGDVSGGLTAPGPSMKSVDFEFSAELHSRTHNEPRGTVPRRRPQTAGASRTSHASHTTRAEMPRQLLSRPATATTTRANRLTGAVLGDSASNRLETMKRAPSSHTVDAGGSASTEADAWRPSYGPLSRSTRKIHARPQHAANRTWAAWTAGNKGEPPKAGGGWRYREAAHRTAPRARHTFRPKVRSSTQ